MTRPLSRNISTNVSRKALLAALIVALAAAGSAWLARECARQAERDASRLAEERMSLASEPAGSAGPSPGALEVAIVDGGFEPRGLVQAASSTPLGVALVRDPPAPVRREPDYRGASPWYGVLTLGRPPRPFAFALAARPDGSWRMWFDADADGDLTDNGAPLVNQGSGDGAPGAFATELSVPWQRIDAEAPFAGWFSIWFYSNRAGWERGRRASHDSRTQLRGAVLVDGQRREAWLVDGARNDADLTNDGVLVDLDGDGALGPAERLGRDAVTVRW